MAQLLFRSHTAYQTMESMELWLSVTSTKRMERRITVTKNSSASISSFTRRLSEIVYVTQSVVVGIFVSVFVSFIEFF